MQDKRARHGSNRMASDCRKWLEATLGGVPRSDPSSLHHYAGALCMLASMLDRTSIQTFTAEANEERALLLARTDDDSPALYLISNGIGARSLPHSHQTWAIIAGVRGVERNTMYRVEHDALRLASPIWHREVRAGDCLILDASAIHATESIGSESTLHLHLYGRPIEALPSFVERCFIEVAPKSSSESR